MIEMHRSNVKVARKIGQEHVLVDVDELERLVNVLEAARVFSDYWRGRLTGTYMRACDALADAVDGYDKEGKP